MMKIFKFGGASVKDAESVKNVAKILSQHTDKETVVVISAMGKSTNAFEQVVDAYFDPKKNPNQPLATIRTWHFEIISQLFEQTHEVFASVNDIFVEIDWILEEEPQESYDYIYDQIVSVGELVSTKIVAAYLNKIGRTAQWLDARDVVLTDNTHREAKVDWETTEKRMQEIVPPLSKKGIVITQGFIGSTSENFTTTLGREGSDFTAAIFAYCLNAKSMSIWKDVPGILTADPRLFKNVTKIDRLSYREAIEMTYYGAKVIHPKTIKPLQNKNITLYVKSFIEPAGSGTVISANLESYYPPVIVVEKNQVLLHISTRNFSFVAEDNLSAIFLAFAKNRIKVNMMQNSAISFSVCVDNKLRRIKGLLDDLKQDFKVLKDENLELITIRHYKEEVIESLKIGKLVILEERIRNNAQIVVKNIPKIERVS